MSRKDYKEVKNVIIVNDFDYIQGGASKVAIENANILVSSNKDINVYYFCGKHDDKTCLDDKIKVICLNQKENLRDNNKIRGFINGIYNIKAKKTLKGLLNNFNPEDTIIHVHGWTKVLSSSIFSVCFKKKFRLVLTLHDYFTACPNGGFFNYKKNSICSIKSMSTKCVFCNCDSRNYIFKMYRILRQLVQDNILKKNLKYAISISNLSEEKLREYLPNTNFFRIYNPIDYPIVKNSRFEDRKKYLYIGRVDKEKGVEDFCKCISELNLEGIVIGTGTEYNRLKEKYNSIDFVGWKEKSEIIKYLSNAKALIFPSLWYETAGLTILEALSQNVPCYVRKTAAGAEFIRENENGCLFKDLEELKIKVNDNKNKTFNFSFERDKFSNETYYTNLLSTYNYIINGGKDV